MSKRKGRAPVRMADIRQQAKADPNWEPRFNDPELRRAYEETRSVFDRISMGNDVEQRRKG